jgi:type IV pilus assembly protein PilW
MNRRIKTRFSRAGGFTLVELMIALVVGLLLLAGVLQVLLGNRESFEAQRARSSLQENARLMAFVLENTVAHAGHKTDLAPNAAAGLFRSSNISGSPAFASQAVVAGIYSASGNDSIRIRYQAEGGLHNCRGAPVGQPDKAEVTDFELYVNDNDTLLCKIIGSGSPQPLVENVERFRIRYGVDRDKKPGVDTYVSNLSAADSRKVRSVRFQLLLKSPDDQRLNPADAPGDRVYAFSDRSTTYTPQGADKRLAHLLVDRTIVLRNAAYALQGRRDAD